jgi:hypothetical protein
MEMATSSAAPVERVAPAAELPVETPAEGGEDEGCALHAVMAPLRVNDILAGVKIRFSRFLRYHCTYN